MIGCSLLLASAQAPRFEDPFELLARPFLERYCGVCHGGDEPEADLDLSTPGGATELAQDPLLWRELAERVGLAEMPPPKARSHPSAEERERFLTWLAGELDALDVAALEHPTEPDLVELRRLNNRQYERAIFDLFGVRYPARERFPEDGIGQGFDTVGEAQGISPLRLEALLDAADAIAGEVLVEDQGPRRWHLGPGRLEGRGGARGGYYTMPVNGPVSALLELPRPGRYRLGVQLAATQAGDDVARAALGVGARELTRVAVAEEADDPALHTLEVPIERAGATRLWVRFLNDYYAPEFPDPRRRDRNLLVGWIELEGPLDPPEPSAFQRDLWERHGFEPGQELSLDQERELCAELVRRVWRRPAKGEELDRLQGLPPPQASSTSRLRLMLQALLSSPNFLYLVEAPASGATSGPAFLSPPEQAARLAAFLWSSVPDRWLDALADQSGGAAFSDSDRYRDLVRTMLADPRAEALGEEFALQWLGLRALSEAQPDPERFPAWSPELARSMLGETQRFFAEMVAGNHPLHELLDADWTFVDGRLAEFYGLSGVGGQGFERVSLAGTPRRGLLGQAGVLAVTSNPTRTSPVRRGKWVLDVLLGSPPPPPPPGTGSLGGGVEGGAPSIREQLAEHRARAECAVCHDRMDPLGLGLEGFDGIGRLRTHEGGLPIDCSGVLPDGRRFEGLGGLVELLVGDPRLGRHLTERLLVYALGRPLTGGDRRAVRLLLERLGPDPGLGDLVLAVAESEPFRSRLPGRGEGR